jgi:hypothetical protein
MYHLHCFTTVKYICWFPWLHGELVCEFCFILYITEIGLMSLSSQMLTLLWDSSVLLCPYYFIGIFLQTVLVVSFPFFGHCYFPWLFVLFLMEV